MADTVEIAGIEIGSRRRVFIDLTLIAAIVACALAFGELRSTVASLREVVPELTRRIDAIEGRERAMTERVATKADVQRVEAQIGEIRTLLLRNR